MAIYQLEVFVVIVCYGPQIQRLGENVQVLLKSGCKVILVDNSDESSLASHDLLADCKIILNGENLGIACAQNIGIRCALRADADIVIFFDQDSKISDGFIKDLIEPIVSQKVAISAPVCIEEENGFEYPSYTVSKFGNTKKVYVDGKVDPYVVDLVISSGMAVTSATFDLAGYMDESLFIDFVDTEWCLRCKKLNVPIFVSPKAKLKHSIGQGLRDFYSITLIVHSPTRCYYQIRNSFHLLRKDSVPLLYALKEVMSVLAHKLLLLFIIKNWYEYAKYYCFGILHGLCGVSGKVNL